jgi:hypothetical protein
MSNCLTSARLFFSAKICGPNIRPTMEKMEHMRNGMANCGYAARNELTSHTIQQRNIAFTADAEEL